jgi:ADP-heptose:LPS heptosyltransferase
MNIIFDIPGGIGKVLMATAVIKGLKAKYPADKIITVSGHPLVFKNNPNVHASYQLADRDRVREKFIKDQECKIIAREPYYEENHIFQREHCLETWFKILDLEYWGQQPDIYLDDQEINSYKNLYKSDKPIMVIQPHGGAAPEVPYNWVRDIPPKITKKLIEKYKDTHTIYLIKSPKQPKYKDVKEEIGSIRRVAILLSMAEKRYLIDSFAQHLAMALRKPSNVFWIGTNPKVFGYDLHNNIKSNPYQFSTDSGLYHGRNLTEVIESLPYTNEDCIFDVEKII